MIVAGETSTGSKRPAALFGDEGDMPRRLVRASGCRVTADDGRAYTDFVMGLGAVTLGYGHPEVVAAASDGAARGVTGPLPPVEEEEVATAICDALAWPSSVRFLKTGAEACAAAVRIARTITGRDAVLGCGYHGWLDWCSTAEGVPGPTRALYDTIPFNDIDAAVRAIRDRSGRLACVIVEPVVEVAPDPAWLMALREETRRCGALLLFDEVKTGFRVAIGGAVERWGIVPDLAVLAKGLANGFPLAAVCGPTDLMHAVESTWISSTAATEMTSLAAAAATIRVSRRDDVPSHLRRVGARLREGLERLAAVHRHDGVRALGIDEMCHLDLPGSGGQRLAAHAAREGLLWKPNAYNFVSLAHDDDAVDAALDVLARGLASL